MAAERGMVRTQAQTILPATPHLTAETHRRIYEAIRARSPERARRAMTEHLEHARWEQVTRETGEAPPDPARAPAATKPAR